MKDLFKLLGFTVVSIIVLGVVGNSMQLGYMEFFGVKFENARREIFEESKPHVHGTIQNLGRLRREYKMAPSDAHRNAIKEMILTEVDSFDRSKLPYNLQAFINQLEEN